MSLSRQVPGQEMEHRKAALGIPQKQAAHVHIRAQGGHHLLALAQQLDGLDPVPVLGGGLKPQGLGGLLHLFGELLLHRPKIALQQLHRLANALPVLLLGHLRAAPAVAVAQVMVQTGPLLADIPGELFLAGGQVQSQGDGVQNLVGVAPGAVGPKVFCPVLRRPAHQGEPGIPGIQVEPDIGIAFVVLQQNIILGLVPLDQGALQHQGLELAVRQDHIKVVDLTHHGPGLFGVAGQIQKILADPVPQRLGLAHIDHRVGGVHHDIHPGMQGERMGFILQFFFCHDVLQILFRAVKRKKRRSMTAALSL